ncbi:jg3816 [Pararge aegeria aegeria]|uniref:Jg3816 protein n=1 Tax=Pararge aegeria aegeria TaxID=348720 RepID=A0A8S4RTK0_9NEOP|nr:jg3816 [Pararge aegeria aegeria]
MDMDIYGEDMDLKTNAKWKKELSQKRNMSSHDSQSEGDTKIEPEVVQPRKKWCSINSQLQHDQVLHDLKCTREMIVIEREKNLLEFEKESHRLQIEKLKLEIDILTKKNS